MPLLAPSPAPASQDQRRTESLPDTVFDSATCRKRGFAKVEGDLALHKLYYEIHGDGPEHVLCIMGMKNCSFSWQRQVEHFGPDPRYSILVFDNSGSGHSQTPRGPYTSGGMAREVIELLDFVGWTEDRGVHCVGVSMGGMIALKLAALVPQRIASLVLGVTSAGHGLRRKLPPLDGLEITARTLFDDELARYMLMLYPQEWLDEVDEDDDVEPKRTNRETRVAEYKHRMKLTPSQSLGQFFQLVATTTHHVPNADLKRINDEVPKVLILSGALDHLIPTDSSTNLKKHMPDAELVVWEDSGHAIHSQRPQRFNELCERVWAEGRDLAGSPRCYRTDSLVIHRRNGRQATVLPPQYYPKGLQDLIDRMWTSSSTKDKPILQITPVSANTVQLSPSELSDVDALEEGESESGGRRKIAVSFADLESESTAEEPSQTHGFKHLVERVERMLKSDSEAGDLSSRDPDEPPKPRQRLHHLVEQVLRRGPDEASAGDPPSSPVKSRPAPVASSRQLTADDLPLPDIGSERSSRSAPSSPTPAAFKLPFAWPRASSRSRDASPGGRTFGPPLTLGRPIEVADSPASFPKETSPAG